ncbi:NAD(P)H-dependent glycerol-3-phosphate dehydrogenase [Sphingobacterium lactis]|uniref:NAD(P)H-dependent glycerol-3-phosphate dehydrogenase n=1 Tax=Sphingobacterium lactis TaxID=797291 RepID=UPI003DA6A810
MIEVSVVGGGSWATAIVKILTENENPTHWYLRRKDQVKEIREKGINPDYLAQTKLDTRFVHPSCDLQEVVSKSQIIIFAVPSAALPLVAAELDATALSDKIVLSAVKGTVGEGSGSAAAYLKKTFQIPNSRMACIAGPCHAEEIAADKTTYLTLSSTNDKLADMLWPIFRRPYVHVRTNSDPTGVGYAAIYKNVLGIASGMADGLGYGDNFLAVLVSNAMKEMDKLLNSMAGEETSMLNSTYTGDLLVTGYSDKSRNRQFGRLIAQGDSADQAIERLGMVAEGHRAAAGLYAYAQANELHLPILSTVYHILYTNRSVDAEFKTLEENLI